LPDREKCKTVVDIAQELYGMVQRPVTIEEIRTAIHDRGYRIPRNGAGGSLITAYLTAGKKMQRHGDGYVPAAKAS